ncbi:MAG: histidinol phosphatase [Flavobacteriales bacterium]|nr:histidinol phosphatase [Flavobacteriales bacterium]
MPFSFFTKKKNQNLFKGFVDFHNHLLPGIDDGSKSIEQSLEMFKIYNELGIEKVIASPHIFKDLYPNTPKTIKKSFDSLKSSLIEQKTKLLGYSAEYMVDEFFLKELDKKIELLTCFKNHVLIEIPFFGELKLLKEALFKLQSMGYIPVLAHPERYVSIKTSKKIIELKKRGCKMQLNALSLIGLYGKEVKDKSNNFLRSQLYDLICTDAHNPYQLKKLKEIYLKKKDIVIWNEIYEKQAEVIVF